MAPDGKITVTEKTSYADTTAQNQINAALIQSGSIPTIQNKLLYELQASKWTANLRSFITELMRSGQVTRYDDIMDRILQETNKGVAAGGGKGAGGKGDAADNGQGGSLDIPEAAIVECVRVIKEELEKVAHVTEED